MAQRVPPDYGNARLATLRILAERARESRQALREIRTRESGTRCRALTLARVQ